MSRWTTIELELLTRLAPRATAAEDLRPFFPRHPAGRRAIEGAAVRDCMAGEAAREEGIVNELPNPLTPNQRAQVRHTFELFETILMPDERAWKQALLIVACLSRGISVRWVVRHV